MRLQGIQRMRIVRGLTQKQLAEKIGVGVVTVGRWECGMREPSLDALIRVADILDVPLDQLVGRTQRKWVDDEVDLSHLGLVRVTRVPDDIKF